MVQRALHDLLAGVNVQLLDALDDPTSVSGTPRSRASAVGHAASCRCRSMVARRPVRALRRARGPCGGAWKSPGRISPLTHKPSTRARARQSNVKPIGCGTVVAPLERSWTMASYPLRRVSRMRCLQAADHGAAEVLRVAGQTPATDVIATVSPREHELLARRRRVDVEDLACGARLPFAAESSGDDGA